MGKRVGIRWGALCAILGVGLTMIDSRVAADRPRWLFGTPQHVPGVNSPAHNDRDPTLTADELEIFFFRGDFGDIPGPQGVHLYGATRPSRDQPFGEPRLLSEINSDGYFTVFPEVSPDGLTLYFLRQVSQGPGTPYGFFTLWSATRDARDLPFGEPVEIVGFDDLPDPNGNGALSMSVSADGRELYFGVDDGNDDSDFYVVTRATPQDPWSQPVPVPPFNRDTHLHVSPAVTPDGRTLFHVEDPAPQNRGSRDITLSVRETTADAWSQTFNLGNAINTDQFESGEFLSRDGSALYFTRASADLSNPTADLWRAPVLPFGAGVPLNGGNGSYQQDFASLGTDATLVGNPLPAGWTFTANDVVFNNATTDSFNNLRGYAPVANGGLEGDADRALVTRNVVNQEQGEFDLRVLVEDAPAQALQLAFDLEVWRVLQPVSREAVAGFRVLLEADSGNGFVPVADLGQVHAPSPLPHPATGTLVNGNDPQYRVAFHSGLVDVDVPEGATLRVRWIASDDSIRSIFGIDNVSLQFVHISDLNGDGAVDGADSAMMFANWGNSGVGDLTRDNVVDAADAGRLFAAWTADAAPQAIPEPNVPLGLIGLGGAVFARLRKRRFGITGLNRPLAILG